MTNSKSDYRAEVDGLRAIAVISVIMYHAKMVLFGRDWFVGGYIGVDIFFVISGYLITRIILREIYETGRFDFLNFYERRARRILPVLFLVVFVSFPFAFQILLPVSFIEYCKSILTSLFFGSNVFFYFINTEYGATDALEKPFLHTWSLGVEEQFYLVFPILTIVAVKYAKPYLLLILVLSSLCSLFYAELMATRNPDWNFYSPFSRYWEMAVGSLLAFWELRRKAGSSQALASKILPVIGLFLVGVSVIYFDAKTPHPSVHTIIPVFGVAMIIGWETRDSLFIKILRSKPLVAIGLVSYSAYLWHFPVFAFARIKFHDLSNLDIAQLIVVTMVLSVISYWLVERPFRKSSEIATPTFCVFAISFTALCVFGAIVITKHEGLDWRFKTVPGFENYEMDNEKLRKASWKTIAKRNQANPDFFEGHLKVLIIGNSYSKDMYNALSQADFGEAKIDFLTTMGFPGEYNIHCFDEKIQHSYDARELFYASRRFHDADVILISTRYITQNCGSKNKSHPKSSDVDGLPYLIKRAQKHGKHVVVMGPTAEFRKYKGMFVADYLYSNHLEQGEGASYDAFYNVREEASRLMYKVHVQRTEMASRVREAAEEFGVPFYDKFPLSCSHAEKKCEAYTDEGYKIYYDHGHYTVEGAKYIGNKLSQDGAFLRALYAQGNK